MRGFHDTSDGPLLPQHHFLSTCVLTTAKGSLCVMELDSYVVGQLVSQSVSQPASKLLSLLGHCLNRPEYFSWNFVQNQVGIV